ncbi:PEP/pyruvate-binding domain-containing protein, partial [Candidatus Omnitrophota bacterium]
MSKDETKDEERIVRLLMDLREYVDLDRLLSSSDIMNLLSETPINVSEAVHIIDQAMPWLELIFKPGMVRKEDDKYIFEETPFDILINSVLTTYRSWDLPTALSYRKAMGISDLWGTGVLVQEMVFGNISEKAGAAVIFTHDPQTGEPIMTGDYKIGSQGEDLVAGKTEHAIPIRELEVLNPRLFDRITEMKDKVLSVFRNPQDIEATFENGNSYVLQARDMDIVESTSRVALTDDTPVAEGEGQSGGAIWARFIFVDSDIQETKEKIELLRQEMDNKGEEDIGIVVVSYYFTPQDAAELLIDEDVDGALCVVRGGSAHATLVARKNRKLLISTIPDLSIGELKEGLEGDIYTLDGNSRKASMSGMNGGKIFKGKLRIIYKEEDAPLASLTSALPPIRPDVDGSGGSVLSFLDSKEEKFWSSIKKRDTRMYNALRRSKASLSDILIMSDERLKAIKDIGKKSIEVIGDVLESLYLKREPQIRTIEDLPRSIRALLLRRRFKEAYPIELLSLLSRDELLKLLYSREKIVESLEEILTQEGLRLGMSIPEDPSWEVHLGKITVPASVDESHKRPCAIVQDEIDSLIRFSILRDEAKRNLIKEFLRSARQLVQETDEFSDEEAIKEANLALEKDENTIPRGRRGRETWNFDKDRGVVAVDRNEIISMKDFFEAPLGNLAGSITLNLQMLKYDIYSESDEVLADGLDRILDSVRTWQLYTRALNIHFSSFGSEEKTFSSLVSELISMDEDVEGLREVLRYIVERYALYDVGKISSLALEQKKTINSLIQETNLSNLNQELDLNLDPQELKSLSSSLRRIFIQLGIPSSVAGGSQDEYQMRLSPQRDTSAASGGMDPGQTPPPLVRDVIIMTDADGRTFLKHGRGTIEIGREGEEHKIFSMRIMNWLRLKKFFDFDMFSKDEQDRRFRIYYGLRNKANKRGKKLAEVKEELAAYYKWAGLPFPSGWGYMNSAVLARSGLKEQISLYADVQVGMLKLFGRKVPVSADGRRMSFINWLQELRLTFWDLPIWPVTESGDIDDSLINWLIQRNMNPPPEYFDAKRVSLRELVDRTREARED